MHMHTRKHIDLAPVAGMVIALVAILSLALA